MKNIILYLLFAISFDHFAQEANIRFEKLSIEDGLSESTVTAIYQDHKGFLWFGTYDGLNRYDGYQFKVFLYDPYDSTSISQNSIRCLFEDHTGVLWVGTEIGISKFDRNKESFINYSADQNNPNSISSNMIRYIFEDRDGKLWIATRKGLNQYDRDHNKFIKYFHNPQDPSSICNDDVRTIFQDSKGTVWIGTANGIDKLVPNSNMFEHFINKTNNKGITGDSIISCISEDSYGSMWVGTRSGGLYRLDNGNTRFIQYKINIFDPFSINSNNITGLLVDRNHNLWITTNGGGLEKYNREKDQFIHYEKNYKDPYSISSNIIYSIYEDRMGIIWIGTEHGGINKFDKRKNQFIYYGYIPDNPQGLTDNIITCFYEDTADKGKTIWIGTANKGFGILNRENGHFTFYHYNPFDENSLSSDKIRCIMKDKYGILWVGTTSGLNKFNLKTKKFTRYLHDSKNPLSLSVDIIRFLFEDSAGNIWVATSGGGLELYDRIRDGFIHFINNPKDHFSLSDNILWCLQEDNSGNLWIGTNDGGLNCLNKSTGHFVYYKNIRGDLKSISDNKILCLYPDSDGNFWVGTAGGGLNKFDTKTKSFIHFGKDNGLSSNTIHAILEDNNKNLWISTPRGLFRFNIKNQEFINYNIYDGLQSNEFVVNSAFKSITGELFFGGINGFNVFNPDEIEISNFKPNIVLTNFQIFNKSIPIGNVENDRLILNKSISETQKIVLSYKDAVFSFEFASMDFTASQKNKYAYLMEGFDKEWNYVGNRNFATYTKLSPGNYLFKVKGTNHDGIWNESYASVEIIITPPFWGTIWFRTTASIFLLCVLIIGYRMRIARMRSINKELEKHVYERTDQLEAANRELESFAYSVSHDLRVPLRAIDGFGSALLDDYNEKLDNKAKDYIDRIRKNSQKMATLIDDLLNMSRVARKELNFEMINLSKLAEDTFNELTEFIKNREIELKLTKDMFDFADSQLMKLCFQNMLDNALKFSVGNKKTIINVGFEIKNNRKIYYVKDNGIGFDDRYSSKLFGVFQRLHSQEEFSGTGIGLATVQRIIIKHRGKIWAESKLNQGSNFYFTLNEMNH